MDIANGYYQAAVLEYYSNRYHICLTLLIYAWRIQPSKYTTMLSNIASKLRIHNKCIYPIKDYTTHRHKYRQCMNELLNKHESNYYVPVQRTRYQYMKTFIDPVSLYQLGILMHDPNDIL
jgi:hypothetical protein